MTKKTKAPITKAPIIKAPVVKQTRSLRSLVPVDSFITHSMPPDYLYQNANRTLDGTFQKSIKKKNTKLKIDYNKMFG